MESENNFAHDSDTVRAIPPMSTAVATAQFRSSYQFVAPANYHAELGQRHRADGGHGHRRRHRGDAASRAIGGQRLRRRLRPLCGGNAAAAPGVHSAAGTAPFGIEVYGYGSYTSYMYPGGLNLIRAVESPAPGETLLA